MIDHVINNVCWNPTDRGSESLTEEGKLRGSNENLPKRRAGAFCGNRWTPRPRYTPRQRGTNEGRKEGTGWCTRRERRKENHERGERNSSRRRNGKQESARMGRESESKCSLEGGSRWSDWSSALPSVGYLGAVQPLLGATPVPGGGEGLMWLPACQAASTIYNVYALAT